MKHKLDCKAFCSESCNADHTHFDENDCGCPTPNTQGASWEGSFIEEGAALEHERWAKWQAWVHGSCIKDKDGNLIIPADAVKRWGRQIDTPYEALSEKEKESDRAEVRQYLPLIRTILSKERAEVVGKHNANILNAYQDMNLGDERVLWDVLEEATKRTLPTDSTEEITNKD